MSSCECNQDQWVVPLAWFAHGLARQEKPQEPQMEAVLEVETGDDSIADALSGDIYDVATRHKCMKLRPKDLAGRSGETGKP